MSEFFLDTSLYVESWLIMQINNIYVALRTTPSTLGGPYGINHTNYDHFGVFSRRHGSDMPCLKCVISFVEVTSFNDAMMSYMMSWHCTCIGHMTIYYKKVTNTSIRADSWLVRFNSVTRDPCVAGV